MLVEGAEQVRQQLLIKLKLWRGEWFLDTEFGTPYLQQILGKQLTMSGAIVALRFRLERISQLARMREVPKTTCIMFRLERISQLARIRPRPKLCKHLKRCEPIR